MADDKKRYVVTGHMAAFDTMTDTGRMRVTFYRGSVIPDDAAPEQIAHHLSVNLIAEVPGSEPAGIDAAGAVVVGDQRIGGDGRPGQSSPDADAKAKVDVEVEKKRADAKAKLPTDGSAPDGRAGQAVWVEYLVARGSNYDDLKDVDKADLQKLAEQQK